MSGLLSETLTITNIKTEVDQKVIIFFKFKIWLQAELYEVIKTS